MRAELANLNHCAVSFLSRAAVNLSWYDSTHYIISLIICKLFHKIAHHLLLYIPPYRESNSNIYEKGSDYVMTSEEGEDLAIPSHTDTTVTLLSTYTNGGLQVANSYQHHSFRWLIHGSGLGLRFKFSYIYSYIVFNWITILNHPCTIL